MPHISGHSISDSVETYFRRNHPEHYLCHQVCEIMYLGFQILLFRIQALKICLQSQVILIWLVLPTCNYLICALFQPVYDANKFAKLVKERNRVQNWLDYNQLKFERHPDKKRPTRKVCLGKWYEFITSRSKHHLIAHNVYLYAERLPRPLGWKNRFHWLLQGKT